MVRTLVVVLAIFGAFQNAVADTENVSDRENWYNFSAGFGPTVLFGAVGAGISIGAARQVAPEFPFFMGVDLGAHIWNYGRGERDALKSFPLNAEGTTTSFPLLATFYYKTFLPLMPAAIPFVGVSLGPNIYSTHVVRQEEGVEVPYQTTTIYAEILLRMGLQIVFSDEASITLEPKLGFLGPAFLFSPQVSAMWTI